MDKWLKHVANLLYRSQNSSYSVGLSCLFSGSVEIKLQYKVVQSSFTVELCRNLEALPRLSKRGSSEQPLGTHRETQQTLWPWNVKWQLPSKRTGGAFSLHWESSQDPVWSTDMLMHQPAHISTTRGQVSSKTHIIARGAVILNVLLTCTSLLCLLDKAETSRTIKISEKKNPWRAASNDQRWLIIHPP